VVASACTSVTISETKSAAPSSTSPPTALPNSPPTDGAVGTAATGSQDTSAPVGDLGLPKLDDVTGPAFKPTTRTGELQVALADGHDPTLQEALDIFDVTMAKMPGATPTSLPDGAGFSATYALQSINEHRLELSPAQLAVVDSFAGTEVARFDSTGSTVTTTASATTSPSSAGTIPTVTPSPTTSSPAPSNTLSNTTTGVTSTSDTASLRMTPETSAVEHFAPPVTLAPAAVARYTRLFSDTLKDWTTFRRDLIGVVYGFSLSFSPTQPKEDNLSNADMATGPSSDQRYCSVTVYPQIINDNVDDAYIKFVFAHELFHCIQFVWNDFNRLGPNWIVEGSAEYAALDLYRSTFDQVAREDFVGTWFSDTTQSLGDRAYDAWPLFEVYRDQYHADPYPAIKAMIRAGDKVPALVLKAGGFDDQVTESLTTTASLRTTTFDDDDWKTTWPGVDPDHGGSTTHDTAFTSATHGIGTFNVSGLPDFAHMQYLVPFTGDVGVVGALPAGGPMTTHANAGTVTIGEGEEKFFCLLASGCVCPTGTQSEVTLTPLTQPMNFAFAESAGATTAGVEAMKWDPQRFCVPTKPEPDAGGTGLALGDPHMTTFNGLNYDFMPLGEFVTTSDPQGGLTVEERNQPLAFGAGISAIAVGTGDHRVTLTANQFLPSSPVTVRLDGKTVADATFSAGDVKVSSGLPEQWVFTWPDGSVVDVSWGGAFFLQVTLSAARAARAVGLLGKTSASFLDDLAGADGTRLPPPQDAGGAFDKAWLVTDKTTLFDYDAGQSTATFRTGQIKPVQPPSDDTVTQCQHGLGDKASTFEVQSCAFDVTASGQSDYVKAYAAVTAARVARLPKDPALAATASPAPSNTTDNSTPPGSATSGAPALTMAGPIVIEPTKDAADRLTGSVTLTAGTVLVAKAACPADKDFDLDLRITLRSDTSVSGATGLCGELWRLDAGSTGDIHEGESYLLVRRTGTYDVRSTTGSETAEYVSVQLFADPKPTVIAADALPAAGHTETLSAIGDSILLFLAPGTGGGEWSVTGADGVCSGEYYLDGPQGKGPDDLGGLCKHKSDIPLGSYSGQIPLVIFDRDGGTHQVTIKKTG
jgi:hypothetical protein